MIIEEDNCLRLQCEVSTKDPWVIISTFLIGWIKAEEKERGIQTSVCSVYWKDTKGEWPNIITFSVLNQWQQLPLYLLKWQYGLTYKATPCRSNHIAILKDLPESDKYSESWQQIRILSGHCLQNLPIWLLEFSSMQLHPSFLCFMTGNLNSGAI